MTTPTRQHWLQHLERIVHTPLSAAATGQLRAQLPHRESASRPYSQPLECVARILCGISPWLTLKQTDTDEAALQKKILERVVQAFVPGCDPAHSDYWGFGQDKDSVVDAALLGHALLRAPALADALPSQTRAGLIDSLRATRAHMPYRNNWLLFSACIEAALEALGAEADLLRVDYALTQHEDWYCGDGWYSDGPVFHLDYYNSLIIHPMMRQILDHFQGRNTHWDVLRDQLRPRAARLAEQLERLISSDGTWPPVGRSLAYRCGVFHHLADVVFRGELPATLSPASIRCALTATLRRSLDTTACLDAAGWLHTGLTGHQPSLAEPYISTASGYFACHIFLPLALPHTDRFWSDADEPWTQVRLWTQGEDLPADHALQPDGNL